MFFAKSDVVLFFQSYLEQYLKVLEEDRIRFIDRVGDAGGGQYVINVKHIFEVGFSVLQSFSNILRFHALSSKL